MENGIKEIIEEFEKTYIWYPLSQAKIKLNFEDKSYFMFDSNGFSYCDEIGIEYRLNEMNDKMLLKLVSYLPNFQKEINDNNIIQK